MANDVTILVAEEDPATGVFLADNLCADGYDVLLAKTAEHAHVLLQRDPDLFLVDVNGKTLGLLQEIRSGQDGANSAIPIIVLSARSQEELHKLRVFEHGGDDFVGKPFSYPELRARIQAVLRRCNGERSRRILRIGDLVIDATGREVTLRGESVELTAKEYALLRTLADDPTRLFTKEDLLRTVWGYTVGTTRTLDSHACRLRKKLSVHGDRFITNVWGVGYRLVDSVVA